MEIFKEFRFEAAHRLPNVPPEHPCARMHGHSYHLALHVRGPVGAESGWVMDFAEVKAIAQPFVDELDHHCLNDVSDLENPTCEQIARWLWRRICPRVPGLSQIVLRETATTGVIYYGEDAM
jgi:6-pyruvoyltetrahydropterin/6-carboxytetrahydropterin synthase